VDREHVPSRIEDSEVRESPPTLFGEQVRMRLTVDARRDVAEQNCAFAELGELSLRESASLDGRTGGSR
jgi:hypothetical protein